jgi:cadmium resistance protein CadD (predicted permease)
MSRPEQVASPGTTVGAIVVVLVSLPAAFYSSQLPEVSLPEVPPPFLPFLGRLGAIIVVLVSLLRAFSVWEGSFPQKKSVGVSFGLVLMNSSRLWG